jgi:hypothetical protein
MRTFSIIAGLIALSAMAGLTHAQGFPTPRPEDEARRRQMQQLTQQFEEQVRARERQAQTSCALPDESTHALNAVVSYEGQAYRCVEVFTPTPPARVPPGEGQTLTVRMAGWIKI